MPVKVGDSFSKQFHFDDANIAQFATLSGDTNPLHHDAAYAASTRFKTIIACGPHVSSLMMGMIADHLATIGRSVGLEFSFRFRSAIHTGETLTANWRVVSITPKPSLKGDILGFEGETIHADGTVATSSAGTAVLFDPT